MMTTEELADHLAELLADTDEIRRVRSYAEVGMLTRDAGLVVTLDDGAEYQITIVKSR